MLSRSMTLPRFAWGKETGRIRRAARAHVVAALLAGLLTSSASAQFEEAADSVRTGSGAHGNPRFRPTGRVLETGDGYQILESNVPSGSSILRAFGVPGDTAAVDPGDLPPTTGPHRTFVLTTLAGVDHVPLPEAVKVDLVAEYGRVGVPSAEVQINTLLIDEVAAAAAYSPDAVEPPEPGTAGRVRPQGWNPCKKKHIAKSQGVSYSLTPSSSSLPLNVAGFNGTLSSTWSSSGQVSATLHYIQKKRCGITYGIEFDRVVIAGELDLNGSDLTYSGTVFSVPERTIAEATLLNVEQGFSFWAGPFLIVISAGLDTRVGLNLSAAMSASVGLRTPVTGRYSFSYVCRESGCVAERPAENTLAMAPQDVQLIAGVSAVAKLEPWLNITADVSAGLYTSALRFAKAAVTGRLGVPASLWGYYGNTCGDADGDGLNETVSAAILDVNADLYAFASAKVLGKEWLSPLDFGASAPWELLPETPGRRETKYTYRRHLLWRDFVDSGSTALSPLVIASATVPARNYQQASYTLRTRPCVSHLAKKVHYAVDWGSEGLQTIEGVPAGTTLAHTWSSPGLKTLNAYLDRDSLGRELRSPITSRAITVEASPGTNSPPVANAGHDYSVYTNITAVVRGSGSDPDENPLSYAWRQLSGPTVALQNANTAHASFVSPATVGSQLVFELQVTDAGGLSAVDQVMVTTIRKPPREPRPCPRCQLP